MIKSLHGLRGVAALSVLFAHTIHGPLSPSLGVVLFFVLSGFLMGYLYFNKEASPTSVGKYAVARLARIYPLFAFVIISTAALNHFAGADIFQLKSYEVDQHLLFAGSAFTVWTISAEFQFYAFFVLLWILNSRGLMGVRGLLLLLIPAMFFGFYIGDELGRISLLRYLHVFLIGMLIAPLCSFLSTRKSMVGGAAIVLILLAYFIVPTHVSNPWFPGSVYADPIAVLICAGLVASCIMAQDSWPARLLGSRVPYWLGEISFGIYLFHRHAQWLIYDVVGGLSNQWIELAAITAISIALAQLGYWVIEVPGRKYGRMVGDWALTFVPKRVQPT